MFRPTEGLVAMSNDYKEARNSPDTLLSMFVEAKTTYIGPWNISSLIPF